MGNKKIVKFNKSELFITFTICLLYIGLTVLIQKKFISDLTLSEFASLIGIILTGFWISCILFPFVGNIGHPALEHDSSTLSLASWISLAYGLIALLLIYLLKEHIIDSKVLETYFDNSYNEFRMIVIGIPMYFIEVLALSNDTYSFISNK